TDTTGRLFREFSVTVASALLVSGFVAVTLSPALCARVLRQGEHERESALKRAFGRFFEVLAAAYAPWLGPVLRHPGPSVPIGAAWVGLGVLLLPTIDQE